MEILEFRAFTIDGDARSGNPAGVVLDAGHLTPAEMLSVAAGLGHSETAFVRDIADGGVEIRYFTPRDEIAFCGHATVATGVVLARAGAGPDLTFRTRAGDVPVHATATAAGFAAVDTTVGPVEGETLDELLAAIRLGPDDLDPALPPAFIRGGNPHPLVAVREGVLDRLDHDGDALLALQDRLGWDGTIPVVHRLGPDRFRSRNPFPRGGIREDPATGSAAAGLGAYLRAGGHVIVPATVLIEQGAEQGRPCRIAVEIPATGRIVVSGTADLLRAAPNP